MQQAEGLRSRRSPLAVSRNLYGFLHSSTFVFVNFSGLILLWGMRKREEKGRKRGKRGPGCTISQKNICEQIWVMAPHLTEHKNNNHIEFPAKLLDYFLRSNRSIVNQSWQRKKSSPLWERVETGIVSTLTKKTENPRGRDRDIRSREVESPSLSGTRHITKIGFVTY